MKEGLLLDVVMTRQVLCRKYKQELEGLDFAPFPGAKGQEFFETVSKQAWQEWLKHQTTLINEKRLNPMQKSFLKNNVRNSSTMTKVLKRQKVGRNKNKSFQRTPLNKRELNIALFLRDIYISNKALQSIHSCLHDKALSQSYIE